MRGRKSRWKPSWPVAARVVRVRPWKELIKVTIWEAPLFSPYLRATLTAHSLASAPELQKKALPMPAAWHSAWARAVFSGL